MAEPPTQDSICPVAERQPGGVSGAKEADPAGAGVPVGRACVVPVAGVLGDHRGVRLETCWPGTLFRPLPGHGDLRSRGLCVRVSPF